MVHIPWRVLGSGSVAARNGPPPREKKAAEGVCFDSILDAIGDTPLVGIPRMSSAPGVRIWAKLEGQNPTGSTKDGIALAMVEAAEGRRADARTNDPGANVGQHGHRARDGGTAQGIQAHRGDRNASEERIGLLRLFGAEIVLSDGAKGTNGSIEVARALATDDRYYMPFQYGNPANPDAHEKGQARRMIRDLPTLLHFRRRLWGPAEP